MLKFSGWFKTMTGIFAALAAAISTGCHAPSNETKDVYGPPPPELDDPGINPKVLDDNPPAVAPKQDPTPNSNEALDVYGPPPPELDDPDINPDMLEKGIENAEEAEIPPSGTEK